MRLKATCAAVLSVALIALLAMAAAPAGAIIGGTQDENNVYSNVGMILLQTSPGAWDLDGSCTLVKNDAAGVVVLTAGHCVAFPGGGPAKTDLQVTFDQLPLPGGTFTAYKVARIEVHPDYLASLGTTPYIGNSKMFGIGPGREDVALLWLSTGPITGLAPSPVVAKGGLSGIDLKQQTFTVVGYGINGFVTGSFMSWRNPTLSVLWSGRNYRQVGVVSTHDAFGDRYLKVSECTAFGDSGGPTFRGDTIVADTVWGGSLRCLGPAYQYRLDTARAHSFLDTYLP